MTRKQGVANRTTRKPATRRVWTDEEDALLLDRSLQNSDIVVRIGNVTSAAVACRRNRLLNQADPGRKRQARSALPTTWSAKRAAQKRAEKAVAAEKNGIYVAVSRLAERCVWNVVKQQRSRDNASANAKANRPRINKRKRDLRVSDPRWRVEANLRSRLADFCRTKGIVKARTTEVLIGTTWSQLEVHLSNQLRPGENMLDKDVDHIFPIRLYDLNSEAQQKQCMHYSNLQPLTDSENSSKKERLPTKAMAAKVARWAWPPGLTEDTLPDCYPTWRTALRML